MVGRVFSSAFHSLQAASSWTVMRSTQAPCCFSSGRRLCSYTFCTPFTAPYPWPYWLVTSQLTEAKPEVALFVEWLDEEVAAWRQHSEF